jgi:dTDP-4-dehydrorhamnose reductase
MRILVFGQSGQVATELARHVPEGAEMICAGRADCDLSIPENAAMAIAFHRPDMVLNAAAWTAVDKAEENADLARKINSDAPRHMAVACANLDIPLVHVSTDYVFDGAGDAPFHPDDPVGPLGVYGATKLAGERAIVETGGRYVILRTSWVFSAHGANFVKTMLRLGADRNQLNVVADQIGGPTPAAAIADAMITIGRALCDGAECGIEHFSGAGDTSWAGFAREIMAQANLNCKISDITTAEYPTPATRPLNSRLDCSGLTRFGVTRPNWQHHLTQVIQELRTQS